MGEWISTGSNSLMWLRGVMGTKVGGELDRRETPKGWDTTYSAD